MVTNNSVNAPTTSGTVITGNGTGFTNIAYSATGGTSNIASRDTSGNIASNNLIQGYTTTATAAGTTTLTVSSTEQQIFTGSTTQTIVLPVTSTLVLGQSYTIVNKSTGIITVQSSGANTIQAMASNTTLTVTVILTSGTTAASWDAKYLANTVSPTGTITQHDVLVGGSGNAITSVSPGTVGFVLTSNGTSADPSFQSASPGASVTFTGDTGTPFSTSSVTVRTNHATNICGSTVYISASTPSLNLNVTDSDDNTIMGLLAGNLSGGSTNCTAFGSHALSSITSGSYNTAIGNLTLSAETTGNDNIALGYNALNASVGSNECIAIGASAMSTGTPNNSIAIGTNALLPSGGGNNIAIGGNALTSSVSDNNNTAIGFESQQFCNGGSNNSSLGVGAGRGNITGTSNTAIGYNSMFSQTSGNNNTSVGYVTFRFGTGDNNLSLGAASGDQYVGTESDNINLKCGGVVGDNYTLRIGNVTDSIAGGLTSAYIQGISGNNQTTSSTVKFVTIDTSGTSSNGLMGVSQYFPYTDEATSFTAVANNGYFCTATLTATLPASPIQGDKIEIFTELSAIITVRANTGQTIRLNTSVSASAGSAVNVTGGSSIMLVYKASTTQWCAISVVGSWTIT